MQDPVLPSDSPPPPPPPKASSAIFEDEEKSKVCKDKEAAFSMVSQMERRGISFLPDS